MGVPACQITTVELLISLLQLQHAIRGSQQASWKKWERVEPSGVAGTAIHSYGGAGEGLGIVQQFRIRTGEWQEQAITGVNR
jgi:hypothetical protein